LCLQRTTDFARRDETRQRLTEQERQERSQQLQKTLTLLVHACSCHDPQCSSTSCRKVRGQGPAQHSMPASGLVVTHTHTRLLDREAHVCNQGLYEHTFGRGLYAFVYSFV
jgi:hypothetical protein